MIYDRSNLKRDGCAAGTSKHGYEGWAAVLKGSRIVISAIRQFLTVYAAAKTQRIGRENAINYVISHPMHSDWWLTSVAANSRQCFQLSEAIPTFNTDYGGAISQWDSDQCEPRL
ncbi:hypothetical protein [Ralstonia sp. 24A2]|uniref:hypothetical protein n=1 Tax=Ralstonia sp. 24A2 TaxID=3447364 RepID=UPI003F69598F